MLRLEAMSDQDFAAFIRKSVPEYAYDQMHAGNWTAEEAAGRARAEFQQMLPNGQQTSNQYLKVVMDEQGHKVGMLWYFVDVSQTLKKAFLIDFFIFPEGRHKGYEAEALALFEQDARSNGATRVELQVFTHKTDDVALYQNNGYQQTSVFFAKNLEPVEKKG
jgi:GNAT superfamily N-acetyltransferase